MIRILLIVYALLFTLVFSGTGVAATVVCLGDSITYGYAGGSQLTTPYPARLQSLLGATVTNAGVSGETTAQMKARWDGSLKLGGYGTLVFLGGVNDIGNNVPLTTTQANIRYIWLDALARGIRVVALTITPWRGDTLGGTDAQQTTGTDALNAWIRSEAASYGIKVIDLYQAMGGQGGDPATLLSAYDSGDHIHPNQAGADFIATSVYGAIKQSVTLGKATTNPILVPDGINGSPDKVAVRDACFVKTSDGTYNAIYTGFGGSSLYPGMATIRLSKSSAWDGPYGTPVTISPHYSTFPADVSTVGIADPFVAYMGGQWHMWVTIIPTTTPPQRYIGHLTAAGTDAAVPTSGWTFENTRSVSPLGTGWSSEGVAAPKVYPKEGGGYIMLMCGWGTSSTYQYQVGYATSSSLNGPWTVQTSSLIGTPGGYQAEQIVYFKSGGKHYLICNRLGLTGGAGYPGFPDLHVDLWQSDSQTGPFTLAQYDFIPRSTSGWDSGDMGVVGLAGYDLDAGTIYAIYNSTNNVGAINYTQSLGAMTITAQAAYTGSARHTAAMMASFR